MFSFCCPKKKQNVYNNSIDQNLIESAHSPTKTYSPKKGVALSESERKKQSSDLSKVSLPLSNIQKPSFSRDSSFQPGSNSKDQAQLGVRPYFGQNNSNSKNSGTGGKLNSKNKSQLFQFQHNTQIIYFSTAKGNQFCLRYLITKKAITEKETKSIINFILAKKSENPYEQEQLILIIPSKILYQSKHMQIPFNVHAIFTNMRRSQKNSSTNIGNGQIIEIIQGDQSSLRTNAFDKIIIIMEGEQDIEFIKNYCRNLAKRYTIQQFLKIWWVFPAFLNLQDISEIIKETLRKFIINESIQKIAKYLYYQIDVIKQLNLEPFILVRNKMWRDSKATKNRVQSKDYQTQICLSIGLFMVEMNETVLPYYKYFLQNLFFEMKLLDYLKYKQLLQNQKQKFFKKLVYYELVNEQGAAILEQNRKMIQHKYQNPDHRRILIKNSARKKFISAFGFQQSLQTGEGNTPVKHQWDDDLKFQDLQIRKNSFDRPSTTSKDLNLIDEQEIDDILLCDLQIDLQQNGSIKKGKAIKQQKSTPSRSEEEKGGQIDIEIEETEI